jgi:hypothetical protein
VVCINHYFLCSFYRVVNSFYFKSRLAIYFFLVKKKSQLIFLLLAPKILLQHQVISVCHKSQIMFYKFFLLWRGFKFFIKKKKLYILLGLSHYILFVLPKGLYIWCRKRKFYLCATNIGILKLFNNNLKNVRKLNLYKGKGLFEYSVFKTKIKIKK